MQLRIRGSLNRPQYAHFPMFARARARTENPFRYGASTMLVDLRIPKIPFRRRSTILMELRNRFMRPQTASLPKRKEFPPEDPA